MTEFTSGYLVFKNVPTLGAAHSLASQMARLNSDVHILDVGFLVRTAWVAGWFSEVKAKEAAKLAQDLTMEVVAVSERTMNAMFSLGPPTDAVDAEALIVESDENSLAIFFQTIEECLTLNWKVNEIRLRKSGPSGVHAFLVGASGLQGPQTRNEIHIARTNLSGDYRRFF
jgi:hypothetical protein